MLFNSIHVCINQKEMGKTTLVVNLETNSIRQENIIIYIHKSTVIAKKYTFIVWVDVLLFYVFKCPISWYNYVYIGKLWKSDIPC